jgi:hypothetical protein
MSVMATSVFCTRSSSAFSTSSRACSCFAGDAPFNLQQPRAASAHHAPGRAARTHVCLAASSSSRLARTAWRAFIAMLMLVFSVVCHGARYPVWIALSCATRASAMRSHAPAYAVSARPSLSASSGALPGDAAWSAPAASVAARPSACGSVLCCAAGGAAGAGAGRFVPLRLAAAKLVRLAPTVVESSERDSWICVG